MDTEAARAQMIGQQVRAAHVLEPEVLRVLGEVPRERFVPAAFADLAFADTSIPLAHGQVMMRPQVEGLLLQALGLRDADAVLEIGTGSGFLTACLEQLGGHVTSLEILQDLAESARQRLRAQDARRCTVTVADAFAWEPDRAYDCIAVTGSLPVATGRFEDWLAPGGRLFAVVGTGPVMEAMRVTRLESGSLRREMLFETLLAPLVNAPQPDKFSF
jgi:protein-L-isoaspartate(D-aspartate) O-methyltransferase